MRKRIIDELNKLFLPLIFGQIPTSDRH